MRRVGGRKWSMSRSSAEVKVEDDDETVDGDFQTDCRAE
jgi:hypothetical protein